MLKTLKYLSLFISLFAFIVVLLGAWTRLMDAGLGCPDWPGCYGHIVIPHTQKTIAQAQQAFPHALPVSFKAWPEMIHRYAAGILSLCIVTLFALHHLWRKKHQIKTFIPNFMVLLLGFQAVLGMWTVTWQLHPLVVMGHLLGGMSLCALGWAMYLRYHYQSAHTIKNPITPYIHLAIGLTIIQILLGGWTSANYASLICTDFPYCHGQWLPNMDFKQAFNLLAPVGPNYEGGRLMVAARTAIQMMHRYGALIVAGYLGLLSGYLLCKKPTQPLTQLAKIVLALLIVQITLGILNVAWLLPMPIGVAHNGTALILLITLITLQFFARHDPK